MFKEGDEIVFIKDYPTNDEHGVPYLKKGDIRTIKKYGIRKHMTARSFAAYKLFISFDDSNELSEGVWFDNDYFKGLIELAYPIRFAQKLEELMKE
mgnify:CR=1 FL=1